MSLLCMPAIKIKAGEPAVPLDKAITLRDFLTITLDVNKAMSLMRKTCLEGNDVVCATYKDQVAHYIRIMLTFRSQGTRGPVYSILRRMGEPEYETVKDIDEFWAMAEEKYPDVVEAEGRAGPEFLEDGLIKKWEDRLAEMIGPDRWQRVLEIQKVVQVEEVPEAPKPESMSPLQPVLVPAAKTEEDLMKEMEQELKEILKVMRA